MPATGLSHGQQLYPNARSRHRDAECYRHRSDLGDNGNCFEQRRSGHHHGHGQCNYDLPGNSANRIGQSATIQSDRFTQRSNHAGCNQSGHMELVPAFYYDEQRFGHWAAVWHQQYLRDISDKRQRVVNRRFFQHSFRRGRAREPFDCEPYNHSALRHRYVY